jgi:hypothetical protein
MPLPWLGGGVWPSNRRTETRPDRHCRKQAQLRKVEQQRLFVGSSQPKQVVDDYSETDGA